MRRWNPENKHYSWVLLCAVLFIACSNPTQQLWPDPLEFESVWQYLKVYSIYQDKIPEHAFFYDSPELMLSALHDTLKGNVYTRYDSTIGQISAQLSKSGYDYVTFVALNDSTGLLTISYFDEGITYNQFLNCISQAAYYPNLFIDLQGNGGGDLNELDSIVEAFLPAGTEYILARERKYDNKSRIANTLEWHPWITEREARPELTGKKITVFVNGQTASAAEILAAALKDCLSATLIGQRTYGKGIGQIRIPRRNRPGLQITYLQLRGISEKTGIYHGIGIMPDSIVIAKRAPDSSFVNSLFRGAYKIVHEDSLAPLLEN